MEIKHDLSDLDMTAGARQAGLSLSETADLLGFSHTKDPRVFTQNDL